MNMNADEKMLDRIRKLIFKKAESLKNNEDTLKSNLLFDKYKKQTL